MSREKIIKRLNLLINLTLGLLIILIPFGSYADALYLSTIVIATVASSLRIGLSVQNRRFWLLIGLEFLALLIVSMSLLYFFFEAQWFSLWKSFLKNASLPLLLLFILANNLSFNLSASAPPILRSLFQISLCGFIAFIAINVLSSFTGINPQMSFYLLRHELLLYSAIFLVVLNSLSSFKQFKRLLLILYLVGLLVGTISIAENVVFYLGNYTIKRKLLRREYIRPYLGQEISPVRSQFPFEHHNRLGFFLLSMAIVTTTAYFLTTTRHTRRWVAFSALLPILGMFLTYTRGAIIAFIPAIFLVLLLTRWQNIFWLILFFALLFIFSPAAAKQHCLSIFKSDTYKAELSSAYLRFVAWDVALRIIKDYPLLGFGYGWKNFKNLYLDYKSAGGREVSHSHNTFLEIACETGLLGAFFFIAAYFSLLALFLGVYLNKASPLLYRRISVSILGLLVSISIFMLTNYVLRYTGGMLVWLIFALALCFIRIIFTQQPISR